MLASSRYQVGVGRLNEFKLHVRRTFVVVHPFACTHKLSTHLCAMPHSTVTDFARLRGLSTSVPRAQAV
jgi:hypothetical protein